MEQNDEVLTAARARDAIREAIGVAARGWWVIVTSGLVLALAAFGWSSLQTPVYKSTAMLYVTSGTDANVQNAYQGSLASQQRVSSYSRLAKSDTVVLPVLESNRFPLALEEAQAALSTSSTTETVMFNISATSTDRGEAAALVNGVSESLVRYVSVLETPADGGTPLAKLTVVSPGTPGASPIAPRTARNTLAGLLAGAILGLLILFSHHRLDTRIRTEREVEGETGLTTLSVVPTDESLKEAGPINFRQGATATGEAFRKLRTNLRYVGVDDPARSILVTSPNQGEGKTTTSINLAAALAEDGSRVVLVDADLRRPGVAKKLGLNGSIGFTDYLRDESTVFDFLQQSAIEGLDVLCSGPIAPNPSELLGARRTKQALDALKERYDYVIVDAPPILPVTDAVVTAEHVDGVLLVVRMGRTKRPELRTAEKQLSTARIPILGTVVNDISRRNRSYAYTYYGESAGASINNSDYDDRGLESSSFTESREQLRT